MPASYHFHPEALQEYREAANNYLREATAEAVTAFVAVVESAIAALTTAPARWRMDKALQIRRCILRRFPYVICYRWNRLRKHITIYAVTHGSRDPMYWHLRMDGN